MDLHRQFGVQLAHRHAAPRRPVPGKISFDDVLEVAHSLREVFAVPGPFPENGAELAGRSAAIAWSRKPSASSASRTGPPSRGSPERREVGTEVGPGRGEEQRRALAAHQDQREANLAIAHVEQLIGLVCRVAERAIEIPRIQGARGVASSSLPLLAPLGFLSDYRGDVRGSALTGVTVRSVISSASGTRIMSALGPTLSVAGALPDAPQCRSSARYREGATPDAASIAARINDDAPPARKRSDTLTQE